MPSLSRCCNEIADIFTRASHETFEDGMDSRFARELDQAFHAFGPAMFIPLSLLAIHGHTNATSELLRWVGYMEDDPTIGCRREVLLIGLERQDVAVRDSAVLGIASMDDPFFMLPLTKALKQEVSEGLRESMLQVLEQLRETDKERSGGNDSFSP